METANNIYRLEQGDNNYILTASIIGNQLRLVCQNSSNENNKKFSRDFTIPQLNKIDKLFTIIKTPEQALNYIDETLSRHKVGVTEENGGMKLTFYITIKGITKEIYIPFDKNPTTIETNTNKAFPNEMATNYETPNYQGNSSVEQIDYESLVNSAYNQNNQDNIYYTQNNNANQYNNEIDINELLQGNNKYSYDKDSIIGTETFVGDTNQTYQNNSKYINNYDSNQDVNQYFQSNYQNYGSNNNDYAESTQYLFDNNQGNEVMDEETKKLLKEFNLYPENDIIQNESNVKKDNNLNNFGGSTVLPPKTTTKVLPVIYNISNINSQQNTNLPYIDNNIGETQNEKVQIQQNIKTTEQIVEVTKKSMNKNKKNSITKSPVKKEAKIESKEAQEIKMLKNQLAELEPLKKKVAEIDSLKEQLIELNTLRAQVKEYNSVKGRLKELGELKKKLKDYNELKEQLSELNELRLKAAEVEKLKLRVEELEELNHKYEEEIKTLKENQRIYSMRTRVSNSDKKDMGYEDNHQDEEITVRGDIIQDEEELALLTQKINKLNQKLTLNLLYKASADSDKAAAFHAKCDEAKSSIVLVETDKGKRFGGYTSCSWRGDCEEKNDEEAFVFSLDKMRTYDNIRGEPAIGCYPRFGPIFLGCQIRIYDDAFTKGGTTFERGLNFDTQEDYELTGGDRTYQIKEIEVYEVIKE